jgi:hypothetical protein
MLVDPTRPNESQDPPGSSEHERPVARGFGEFSGAYRARWALSHPDMQKRWPPAGRDSESQLRGVLAGAQSVDERPEAETSSGDTPWRNV